MRDGDFYILFLLCSYSNKKTELLKFNYSCLSIFQWTMAISFKITNYLSYYIGWLDYRKSFILLCNYFFIHDNPINLNCKLWKNIFFVEFLLCGSNNIVFLYVGWWCHLFHNNMNTVVLRNYSKQTLLTLRQLTISLSDYILP